VWSPIELIQLTGQHQGKRQRPVALPVVRFCVVLPFLQCK
jgi:hypothetical protein